jgi:7-cyano-7-deazaguanine reductase
MPSQPSQSLDVFPNPAPARDYVIHIDCPEFTCLCPLSGQPDFATLVIDYIPDKACIELKALKLYLWSFRDRGAFHEAVTNEIVDALAQRLKPRFLRLTARWYVRGGIYTTVVAEHRRRGWKPAPRVDVGAFDTPSSVRG